MFSSNILLMLSFSVQARVLIMTLMVSHIKVLARTAEEHADKQRAALGKCVWRLDTGEDSLEDKHVGPSAYAKAQGTPIMIWGFFCDGHLEYYVLPKEYTAKCKASTQHMNGNRYKTMVDRHFAKWCRKCTRHGRVFVVKLSG